MYGGISSCMWSGSNVSRLGTPYEVRRYFQAVLGTGWKHCGWIYGETIISASRRGGEEKPRGCTTWICGGGKAG
jgi:hypothetical protein